MKYIWYSPQKSKYPLYTSFKELLVSDLGLELFVITVMSIYSEVCTIIRYCLFCIYKGSGVVIVSILNSDLESKKKMRHKDDN